MASLAMSKKGVHEHMVCFATIKTSKTISDVGQMTPRMGASKHILVYTCLFCRHKTSNTSDVGLMTPKMG